MISVSFSTVGQEPASSLDVVWNGTIERQHVLRYQQPAPKAPPKPEPDPSHTVSGLVAYLRAHAEQQHDSLSLSLALHVPQPLVAHWLYKLHVRGVVKPVAMVTRGGRPCRIYQVVTR